MSNLPVVSLSGSRALPLRFLPVVSSVVRGAVTAGFAPAVGCCVGADALVISSALLGGFTSRLSILAAFGPDGKGAFSDSALSSVLSALAAGARVSWWSGGSIRVPPMGRLAQRSVALCRFTGGFPHAPFIAFVTAPCPAGLRPASSSKCFSGSGSGSWASLAYAAGLGRSVFIVWCGSNVLLPAWPGGSWLQSDVPWLRNESAGERLSVAYETWSWVPVGQTSLF